MTIEIVNMKGELVTEFILESNPFKIGEKVIITVANYDKEFWNTKEVFGEFRVENIEHFLRKDYLPNHTYSSVFVTSVKVSEYAK